MNSQLFIQSVPGFIRWRFGFLCLSVCAVLFCEPSIKGAARDRVFFAGIKAKHSLQITAFSAMRFGKGAKL